MAEGKHQPKLADQCERHTGEDQRGVVDAPEGHVEQHEDDQQRGLEQKHTHAREALEHYRASVKEQREQELRRHEHQVQQLQVDLREARDGLVGKNQELLHLNRDNVRLTEHAGQHDREARELRAQVRRLDEEIQTLRSVARERDALQLRCAQEQLAGEALRADLLAVRADLVQERDKRQAAETAAALTTVRAQAIEDMLSRLSAVSSSEISSQVPEGS